MVGTTPMGASALSVLDRIPFHVDIADVISPSRAAAAAEDSDELATLIDEAHRIGRPQALYVVSYVGERGDDWLELEGVRLTSRVLRVNLDATHRVFPFLVTCGRELHDWTRSQPDLLREYWAQAISEAVLRRAMRALTNHLEDTFALGPTARMSPGSLEDWPIQQQRALFALFRQQEQQIGVELTEHMLMQPTKTISGICYSTDVAFASCQLCPRDVCPGRRMPYSPELWVTRYAARTTA